MGTEGDAKIYARAVDERDPKLRQTYREVLKERIDWASDEPNFHSFSIDVGSAGFISFAEPKTVIAWDRDAWNAGAPVPGPRLRLNQPA